MMEQNPGEVKGGIHFNFCDTMRKPMVTGLGFSPSIHICLQTLYIFKGHIHMEEDIGMKVGGAGIVKTQPRNPIIHSPIC